MENKLNKYCVYIHRRESTGQIFYVGKGTKKRAFSRKGRNPYWANVADKHGRIVQFVSENMPEACAFSLERALICAIGINNLTNLSLGGEGPSGWVMPKASRDKLSKAKKGKRLSPQAYAAQRIAIMGKPLSCEHKDKISLASKNVYKGGKIHKFYHHDHGIVEATASYLKANFGLGGNADALVSGRIRSTKGWSLYANKDDVGYRSGNKHHNTDKNLYSFVHPEHGEERCLRHELSRKYGVSASRIGQLVRGEKPSCNGWRMKRV